MNNIYYRVSQKNTVVVAWALVLKNNDEFGHFWYLQIKFLQKKIFSSYQKSPNSRDCSKIKAVVNTTVYFKTTWSFIIPINWVPWLKCIKAQKGLIRHRDTLNKI